MERRVSKSNNRTPGAGVGEREELLLVNPFRCRIWEFHDRLDEYLTEESCKEEIASVEKHGQVVPVLGRCIRDDPDYDVELIFGARRLFVARHLNKPLLVRVKQISDHEALLAMEVENRLRMDISAYERGLSYARWMRAGLFKSQEDVARALHISPATVSRLLRISRLPSVVLNAFRSPLDIAEDWGLQLADAWDDPTRRTRLAHRARAVAKLDPRPPARVVFTRLAAELSAPGSRRPPDRDEIVLGSDGRPLFRIRTQRKLVALCVPSASLDAATLSRLKQQLTAVLDRPDGPGETRARQAPDQ
jgi:ParB family transcriptional regulator, chromosome partitioning protein